MCTMVHSDALGQQVRPENSFYVKPSAGLSSYLGDNDKTPINLNMDAWKVDGKAPLTAGLELGYHFNNRFDVGLGYRYGDYPVIRQVGNGLEPQEARDTDRHTVDLLLRYMVMGDQWRVSPYIQAGVNTIFGYDRPAADNDIVIGPSAGIGLDFALTDRSSIIVEWNSDFSSPDMAIDGRDNNGFGQFDMLGSLSLGLKFNFNEAFVPVEVYGVEGPMELTTGETGTYSANTNTEDASTPATYEWDFGDGETGTGLIASHRYDTPGNYTVTFTGSNRNSTDVEHFNVLVTPPPAPAEIMTMAADPMQPDTRTEVQFTATSLGDSVVTYTWDFGDGNTATGTDPAHTFAEPGTYSVELTASNDIGSDTRSLELTVVPYMPEYCATTTEMNPAFFDRNSAELSEQGRAQLDENLMILMDCANMNVRIEGWASPNERSATDLSTERAQAVEAYYIENGVAASRIVTQGNGTAGDAGTKDGASQYRRVDSVPTLDN
jgi:PKD repeat protein